MQDGLGDLCDGGCEMGWGCAMVAIIDIIALAATMDLHSNVNRLPLLSKNPQRERCSSHRRPRTAKTHKGQIRDLQQRGETHDIEMGEMGYCHSCIFRSVPAGTDGKSRTGMQTGTRHPPIPPRPPPASSLQPRHSCLQLQAFNHIIAASSSPAQLQACKSSCYFAPLPTVSEKSTGINMADNSSTIGSSAASAPTRSDDPAWAHARVVPEARNNTICLYCNKLIKGGGITRLKYHFAGIRGQVESCKSAPDDVKWQMKQLIEDLNKSKQTKRKINADIVSPYGDPIDIDEEEGEEGGDVVARSVSQSASKRAKGKGVQTTSGKKGPGIQNYFAPRATPWGSTLHKKCFGFKSNGLRKDAETLFGIFDTVIQEIAHCLDLMLENIADRRYFSIVDDTVKKAKHVTKFIYNHGWVLDLMRREYTNGKELCQPTITRFATNFLSLQYFIKFKKELRQMFTSDQWVEFAYAKSVMGKEVSKIVLEDHEFWSQCHHIVKIIEPLVRVFRLVDGDEKPAMRYLYETMDRAKEEIKVRMKHKVSLYGPYVQVIDARWDKQLYSHLHAACCFLNLAIYFRPTFTKKNEVHRGLLATIMRLVRDPKIQDKISSQLDEYKKSIGDFGMSLAIRQCEKLNPELCSFAIRVLNQCCNATGCERNWSIFENVHSKRRNRLEHKRTNDLVFVRYNLKLRERTKNTFDPISLDNIDLMAEWVAEEPGLLDEDDLNWDNVNAPIAPVNVEDDDKVIVLNEDIADDDRVVKENQRRVLARSFDTPCDTPVDSLNPYAVDGVDDNDVFDFGEFDK
uniref:BED-type domain-containing protein n=1 Tax=Fagus sylvatica TaxID=28930 RepID=A0A2N9EDY6_FAGSY